MEDKVKASQQNQEESAENKKDLLGQMDECGQRAQYHNLVDILFVIDTTGSMSWCISQLKKTVCKIMKKFSDKQYNIKFAMELYRDHPPQEYSYIEKHFDLRNQDDIIKVIDAECDAAGGGDLPEAVMDGLVNGLKKTSWRISTDGKTKSKRFLFHGCDAPPHGKEYGSNSSDSKWSQNGCPCGLTRHDVKKLLDEFNVDYSLIKCGNQADTMATLFKQCFSNHFKRQLEIKQNYKSYGKRGKMQRKLSASYMEEIQRQEQMGSEYSYQEQQQSYKGEQCIKSSSIKIKEKSSIFSAIKNVFAPKAKCSDVAVRENKIEVSKRKRKRSIKLAEKKQKQEQNCSSDSDQEGRPRSMASLVLSDIEDGVQDYFEKKK